MITPALTIKNINMDKIVEYLNGDNPDFDEGYNLLAQRLKNKLLLKNIARRRNHSKLLYELGKIAGRKSITPRKSTPIPPILKTFDKSDLVNAPREVQLLYDEAMALYADQRGVHALMRVASNDSGRASLRATLIASDDRRREIYRLLDDWVITGNTPAMPNGDRTPVVSAKEINSAAAGLTRNLSLAQKALKEDKSYSVYVERVRANYNILLKVGRKFGERTLAALKKIGVIN